MIEELKTQEAWDISNTTFKKVNELIRAVNKLAPDNEQRPTESKLPNVAPDKADDQEKDLFTVAADNVRKVYKKKMGEPCEEISLGRCITHKKMIVDCKPPTEKKKNCLAIGCKEDPGFHTYLCSKHATQLLSKEPAQISNQDKLSNAIFLLRQCFSSYEATGKIGSGNMMGARSAFTYLDEVTDSLEAVKSDENVGNGGMLGL